MTSKPPMFFKITPINPDGVTYVDLGLEMCPARQSSSPASPPDQSPTRGHTLPEYDHDSLVAGRVRHSSLPPSPSPTRAEHDHDSRVDRHRSLPPPGRLPKMKLAPLVEDSIEEMDDEMDNSDDLESIGGVIEPPAQNSKTLKLDQDRVERDSEAPVGPVYLVTSTSNGMKLARSSASIKNVKNTKTCWFFVSSECAISKPHTLHLSVTLELGDLFINQFFSEKHKDQALQVWVLAKVKGSDDLLWKQVLPNEKLYHPKLKDRILAFQPSEMRITPTWIKPKTDRPSRAMPLIVCG